MTSEHAVMSYCSVDTCDSCPENADSSVSEVFVVLYSCRACVPSTDCLRLWNSLSCNRAILAGNVTTLLCIHYSEIAGCNLLRSICHATNEQRTLTTFKNFLFILVYADNTSCL